LVERSMRFVSKNLRRLLFGSLLSMSFLPAGAIVRLGDLGPLEIKFFSHQYDRETPAERLDRLERLVFGSVQSGSIEERVAKISKTVDTAAPESQSLSSKYTAPKVERQLPSQPETAAGVRDNSSSDYPRVSELERSLLGRTYVGEPVRQRLSRLETKAYGAPSRVDDLAIRVDKLSSYAGVYGMQAGDSTLMSSPNLLGSAGLDSSPQARAKGMLEQVSVMESKVFGYSNSGHALGQRIGDLERKVFGSVASNPTEDMTIRVGLLWARTQSDTVSVRGTQTAQTLQPFSAQSFGGQSSKYSQLNSATQFGRQQYGGSAASSYGSNGYNPYSSYNSNTGSSTASPFGSNVLGSAANGGSGVGPAAVGGYSGDPYGGNVNSASQSSGAYNSVPFMAGNGMSNNQFGKVKGKYKNKSQQHGSLLGKIGKVVAFAGSAAVGAGGLAVGAMGSMNTGYYGMSMGSGFGSPYAYRSFAPGYSSSNYGSVSTIGSFGSMSSAYGSPFASSYASSFFSP
jgi:hypothetical protein